MRTLFQLLTEQEPSRVALVTRRGATTVRDLLVQAAPLRAQPVGAGQTFVVSTRSTEEFVADLVWLDGWARGFLLQPRGTNLDPVWLEMLRRDFPGPLPPAETTGWLIGTSGTTGQPKLIAHDFSSLTATTKVNLAVGARYRWGLLYDPARFAGLQVVLQALVGGGVLVVPDLGDLEAAVEFLADQQVNALSATPSYWRRILMTRACARLPLRQLTLGGEIADQSVLAALGQQFPGSRIVHIYASTEAGVGFSVTDGQPGFPRSYLGPGALPGIELKVDGQGRLLLRRPRLPAILRGGSPDDLDNDGFLDTGDLVGFQNDRVVFLGRSSGTINVGGNKVCPEEVEAVLCTHPRVVAAQVYGRNNSVIGNLVAANVQLEPGFDPVIGRAELTALCRERLPRWKRPVDIRIADRIELASSGKKLRPATANG